MEDKNKDYPHNLLGMVKGGWNFVNMWIFLEVTANYSYEHNEQKINMISGKVGNENEFFGTKVSNSIGSSFCPRLFSIFVCVNFCKSELYSAYETIQLLVEFLGHWMFFRDCKEQRIHFDSHPHRFTTMQTILLALLLPYFVLETLKMNNLQQIRNENSKRTYHFRS